MFEDTFDGPGVDTRWWSLTSWGGSNIVNGVYTSADNVNIVDGELVLTLSAPDLGASVNSNPADSQSTPGKVGFEAKVGSVCEARIYMPGDGKLVYNWGCWWTAGQWVSGSGWKNGEHDIVEVLGGWPGINYHALNFHREVAYPGYVDDNNYTYWGDAWHTYSVHRQRNKADYYWDGKLVASQATSDTGKPHSLILTNGAGSFVKVGESIRVDYVRVWEPA